MKNVSMGFKPISAAFVLLLLAFGSGVARAQECPGDFCDHPIRQVCDDGGFLITLLGFVPAPPSDGGFATYTYSVCSPAGTCSGDASVSCHDDFHCGQLGVGTCDQQCPVDKFKGLSHFNVDLGGLGCLTSTTGIMGSCSNGNFVVGPDGACGGIVAKCDNVSIGDDECLMMTVQVPGEESSVGPGAALVVSKAGPPPCNGSCIEGPSCDPCDFPPPPFLCLTRTAGFWGTHPHITDDFLPVTVCGEELTTTSANSCESATEALCVSGGRESRGNPQYAQLVRQLTAAKLNLAASEANGVFCGEAIEARIAECEELYCDANKNAIEASGCIEDLTEFNESQDGLVPTPPPFDMPGPADSRKCRQANGNGLVIGKGQCNN